MIIDSQIHAYEANTPKRPWRSVPNWPPSATGEEQLAAQDKLGIDGAIFISAFSIYGYDARSAAALGRPAEGAGARPAQECGDQSERRLHVVTEAVSLPGHLGSAQPPVRRLGLRALPVGHRLDPRLRRRQLRAGRRALP